MVAVVKGTSEFRVNCCVLIGSGSHKTGNPRTSCNFDVNF